MDRLIEKLKRMPAGRDRVGKLLRYGRDVSNLSRLIKGSFRLKPGKKDKKGKVRAVLAFDTTSSMGGYRERVKQDLRYLVDGLDSMLEHFELAVIGCGDHCDGKDYLQVNPYSGDVGLLKRQISGIRDTYGGDEPEAFECLFYMLNHSFPLSKDSSLILITDSVPHGMTGYTGVDSGCPLRRDYKAELAQLKEKINGFYIVNCGDRQGIKDLQRTMVEHGKYIFDYNKVGNLATLVMGMCMSEVGRLDYMMGNLERE